MRLRAEAMRGFFRERLEFYLREVKGQAYDVVAAVLAAGADDVQDAIARAEALTVVRGGADFVAVSAAFKRMKNILAQAADVRSDVVGTEPAEVGLAAKFAAVKDRVDGLRAKREYTEALLAIATAAAGGGCFL